MFRDCYICLRPCRQKNYKDDTYLVDYKQHYFECNCTIHAHKRCIQTWINRNPTCIICRRKLSIYKPPIQVVYEKFTKIVVLRTAFILYFIWVVYNTANIIEYRDKDI